MHPDRLPRLLHALVSPGLVLTLAACATSPASQTEAPPQTPVLGQLEERLPGRYVSVREGEQALQRLRIQRIAADPGRELEVRLTQHSDARTRPRVFELRLSATPMATRLRGQLALLDSDGERRRSCPMSFQAGDEGLVGETDADRCIFGEGDDAVGLLKEMAFDGSRLTIGDRLVDPASGQPRGEDRIITFLPQPSFEGWAGRLEGGRWRVARAFALAPGGEPNKPVDAADMPLNLEVSLDYYRMARNGNDEGVLLRLTVRDTDNGQIVGESWAEPHSRRIGLALPDVQVGLAREVERQPR